MVTQRLQDTDFFILKEFNEAVGHLVRGAVTLDKQVEVIRLSKPFLQRLRNNGHDMQTCADLMYTTLGLRARLILQQQPEPTLAGAAAWDKMRQF